MGRRGPTVAKSLLAHALGVRGGRIHRGESKKERKRINSAGSGKKNRTGEGVRVGGAGLEGRREVGRGKKKAHWLGVCLCCLTNKKNKSRERKRTDK